MGLFKKNKSGGVMNVIRCDEQDYLVWKWRPEGQEANSTKRENAIRYGSSLRVKDGEVAVFVYRQKDGAMQDFIVGPYDDTIKTANFPVLAGIVGLAFGGDSPFQAEVYFINLSNTIQIKFGIPYFDVSDPRFPDMGVPVAAGGSMTFAIDDYRQFIKQNRLIDFTLGRLEEKVKDAVTRRCKGVISNAPTDMNLPLAQLERRIDLMSDYLKERVAPDVADFGVKLRRFDLSRLTIDKDSEGWRQLRSVTAEMQQETLQAQQAVNLKNMAEMQAMNAENLRESMRANREEAQRAQRLQSEQQFIGAHAINKQAEVLKAGAENLGQMGTMNLGGGGDGGFNPAGMMMGMGVGAAMGQQMAGMM